MGNWISKDSYLDKHACSARNITWQYIHSNGSLPTAYADCPGSQAILNSHCCQEGRCHPTYFLDMEFERYEWNDWDGLGSPYMPDEKASSQSWLLCKVMWGEDERHSHIIGVDGKDVKNESAIYPTNEVDIKGNHLTERGLMSGPDMSKHFPLANPDHQTSHRMIGNNSDAIVSSPSPARAQKPITGGLLPWTDQYQSQINDGTKHGILVAGIITVSVIGLICLLVSNPPCTVIEMKESSTPSSKDPKLTAVTSRSSSLSSGATLKRTTRSPDSRSVEEEGISGLGILYQRNRS
jgi:hypothetical protein